MNYWCFLSICLLIIIMSLFMMYRNFRVHEFRMRLLAEEDKFIRGDVNQRWKGKFIRFESLPSYDSMLLHFWKPLSSYEREFPLNKFYKEVLPFEL